MRVAKSLGNLGLLYRVMGEYGPATAAHTEAMSIYQKLGNQELTAVAWLNIGAAHFINHKLDDAIAAYQQSLTIGQSISLPLIELKAHYNLAEALGAATRAAEALHHWEAGYQLCRQHNFDDQEADFLALRTTLHLPTTSGMTNGERNAPHPPAQPTSATLPWLDADEQAVVALVQAERTLTPKRLMDAAAISRATATRRLTALVERGVLAVEGKGRGTYYYLAEQTPPVPVATGDEPDRASIATTLQPHQAELLQRYGVTALGLLSQEKSGPLLPFIVCFATMPTLPAYRHLKRHLTQLLQCELDLLLEEEAPTTALCWLWRTEE